MLTKFPRPVFHSLGQILRLTAAILALVVLSAAQPTQAGKCPNLVILLDKSGSMISTPAGGTAPPGGSKWEIAVAALKELLSTYNNRLPIGLALFASDDSCGAARLDIPPAYNTATAINSLISAAAPNSATPTSESIISISGQPALSDPTRQQYMLLLTDGEPSCASGEPDASVNALTAAHMQSPSITTLVLGFGALPASAAMAMDRMAVAGGAPSMGTPTKYYTAEDLTSLKASLEKIISVVMGPGGCDASCYAPDIGCPMGQVCIRGKCQSKVHSSLLCSPQQPLASYVRRKASTLDFSHR